MYKVISAAIIFLAFLFQFPAIIKAAATISPNPIPNLNLGQQIGVTVSGLSASTYYLWDEINQTTGNHPYTECFLTDASGGDKTTTLGPYYTPGTHILQITASDQSPTGCIPIVLSGDNKPFDQTTSNQYTVGDPTCLTPTISAISGVLPITLGETNPRLVTICGLISGKIYSGQASQSLSVVPPTGSCFRADNTGVGHQFLGPYISDSSQLGNWTLNIFNTGTSGAGIPTTGTTPEVDCFAATSLSSLNSKSYQVVAPCTMSTEPTPIIANSTKSAAIIVDVGNNGLYSGWQMAIDCGAVNINDIVSASIVQNSTTKISSTLTATVNNICNPFSAEFSQGTHNVTIKRSASSGYVDWCKTSYKVELSSTTVGLCEWDRNIQAPEVALIPVLASNSCVSGTVPTEIPNPDPTQLLNPSCGCQPTSCTLLSKCTIKATGAQTDCKLIKDCSVAPPPPPYHPATGGGSTCGTPDINPGFNTAIGCIYTNPAQFVQSLLRFILGIGGGLAFLLMLMGAFQMLTSAGNPETLHAGKDRFTSAIIGLLFIIFSILLLQIIGVDILGLEGFGR